MRKEWKDFTLGEWVEDINVESFIKTNYRPYYGDHNFLASPTEATKLLLEQLQELRREERQKGGVLDMETSIPSSILSYTPSYLNKTLEKIVGLQTDKPLKRAFMPNGGIRVAAKACETHGYHVPEELIKKYTEEVTTQSDAIFREYTEEMRKARHNKILTGLPDSYGRGRIIGDYRRIALYGTHALILNKSKDIELYPELSKELYQQISSLLDMTVMAQQYGCDISRPAATAQEAIQWLYFGYLAAIKTQNGAAMSVGRIAVFLDIYIERDLNQNLITEQEAQELIDQFILKLRMVRFARTPEYDSLFSGDPVWATIALGGMGKYRTLVTKTDFRFLHTLENLGPHPEPNLTILYSQKLPEPFKKYAAKISIETSSIQYENDDLMSQHFGRDYGVCCCVSGNPMGDAMQYFGARTNLAKALLYSLNGGRDEITHEQVAPAITANNETILTIEQVKKDYGIILKWLAKLYIETLNIIHENHDKYNYEAAEMALLDTDLYRYFATGIAGFSHVVDSLSAIKYAKVKPIRESGLIVDFEVEGDFPRFGNDDDKVDEIAAELLKGFSLMLKKHPTYRDSAVTTSILTITSNVVYGKATGALPDGRKLGEPFSPGANPAYGAERNGLLASLNSIAKLPYEFALDGISNTQTISPSALGHSKYEQINNLVTILDGYFMNNAQHININIFDTQKLIDIMENPNKEEYQNFTIRVSGYAVNFIDLTKEQQLDVIARTCHKNV